MRGEGEEYRDRAGGQAQVGNASGRNLHHARDAAAKGRLCSARQHRGKRSIHNRMVRPSCSK